MEPQSDVPGFPVFYKKITKISFPPGRQNIKAYGKAERQSSQAGSEHEQERGYNDML